MEVAVAKRHLTADDIADWFINRVDTVKLETITLRQVMNLVYFAQAWYVTHTGRKLFEEEVEAGALGPVLPSIYDRFSNLAATNIPKFDVSVVIKGQKLAILNSVADEYCGFSSDELAHLSTVADGPWAKARYGLSAEAASDRPIDIDEMKKYYGQRIGKV